MPRVTERRPWLPWYGTARWQRIRKMQLAAEPLCRMCEEVGDVTAATVCDHIEPHRGDAVKFWSGPFQSLCASHHSREKQAEEHGRKVIRYGADGYPL
jgi:5-methylcytosine-specific restriction protein A